MRLLQAPEINLNRESLIRHNNSRCRLARVLHLEYAVLPSNRKFRKRSRYVRSPDMFAIDMVAPPEVRARGPDRTQCGHPGGRWGDGGAAARDLPYSFTFPGSPVPLARCGRLL